MTKAEGRLGRVTRGLDARERVLLLHQALIEDRSPDPQIRLTTPPEQFAEANHYIALCNGVLNTLALLALSVAAQVEGHRMRLSALLALAGWGLERPRGKRSRAKGPSVPAELFPITAPPALESEIEPSIDDVARIHAWEQRCGLAQSWSELRAIEIVLDEVRAEFGGAEVAPQDLVERLRWSREQLLSLCEAGVTFTGAIELPEAEDEMLRLLRAAVQRYDHAYA